MSSSFVTSAVAPYAIVPSRRFVSDETERAEQKSTQACLRAGKGVHRRGCIQSSRRARTRTKVVHEVMRHIKLRLW